MPGSEGSPVGSVTYISHYFHTNNCVHHNLVDMLLYASSGVRAPRTSGAFQEETPQGYPVKARFPLQQDRRIKKEIRS